MTNWLPGITALGAGLSSGVVALLFYKRTQAARAKGRQNAGDGTRKQASAQEAADAALEALRELDADKHHYAAPAFAAEKARLEQVAAQALRARDGEAAGKSARSNREDGSRSGSRGSAPAADAASGPVRAGKAGFAGRHPQLVGALWGGGLVAFCWLAFFLVSNAEPAPGAMRGGGAANAVTSANDPRYESLLVLSAIAISIGDHEKILQGWELYMNQPPPRRRPPMLQKAYDWLEKVVKDQE